MTFTNRLCAYTAAFWLVTVASAEPAATQELEAESVRATADPGRPRIGLVLGGGGARGAAHIGVLKELERQRVPIDAIVGTSMGAIVGGLYASGVAIDELEDIIETMDWADALSDRPDRDDLSFRRKRDDEQFPIGFELGWHDGRFRLPQGAIQGHSLDLVLRNLTLHASEINDFDDLPIPFRAIGTDIERGERYVMGDGDLALAIRASMSVPGAFAPVEVDGRLLVDGGIVGNLGVDVAHEMDVDVVIAVDVEFPLYAAEELDSVLRVSEQILTIVVRNESKRQIEMLDDDDILIRPDLGTFGSTNFGESENTIPLGVDAAAMHSERLQELALGDEEFREYLARRTVKPDVPETIDFVRVMHDAAISDERIDTRMELEPGDPVDPDELASEADRLFGLLVFEKVGYQLVEEGGLNGVEFRARPKSWGPTVIRFGLSLEDDFEGSTGFNIAARLIRPQLNRLGAEFVLDARVGTDPLLAAEFYQPVRFDSRIFIAPAMFVGQRNVNAFVNQDAVARIRLTEAELRLDAGAQLGRAGEFRAGIFRGAGEARVKVGDPLIPNRDFDQGGFRALLRLDTFDNAQFPRHGIRAGARWTMSRESIGADINFDKLDLSVISAWSRGKNTILFGADYATTPETTLPLEYQTPLGGFLRLSGLERGEIVGTHAGLARLIFYRRIGDEGGGLLQVPMYLGVSAEAGNVWQSRSEISASSLLFNGSLFFGLDTFVGPLYLAAGYAEDGQTNFYLFIGSPPF